MIHSCQHQNTHIQSLHVASTETMSSRPEPSALPAHRVQTGHCARTFVGELLRVHVPT